MEWQAGAALLQGPCVWRAAASWCSRGLHEQACTWDWLLEISCLSLLQVPGYGLAVAGAQYAIADLVKTLVSKGVRVRWVALTAQPIEITCNTCHPCC